MSPTEISRSLFRFAPIRAAAAAAFLARGAVQAFVDPYRAITQFAWIVRVARTPVLSSIAYAQVARAIEGQRAGKGPLIRALLRSPMAEEGRRRWLDRDGSLGKAYRDMLVLKAPAADEKGVLLLKYTAKFEVFASLFDVDRIMRDYYLVLEPCWAGYCDPGILLFIAPSDPVVVQAPDAPDFAFIRDLGTNLVPIDIGASDWVDAELFSSEGPPVPPDYDLVMVANWGRHKNHRRLFEALRHVRRRPLSVLLMGFPWAGRTAQDVLDEASACDLKDVRIEVKESLPAAAVAEHLRRSRAFVLLSEKEGSNKAIVEALFCDVPAIVYDGFVGGARNKITPQTGLLTSFADLAPTIERMLESHDRFTPRAWALAHTGSRNATARLNAHLKALALSRGERWTVDIVEKLNRPNLAYRAPVAIPPTQQAQAIGPQYLRPAAGRAG
jgi:glycosyltransferase involved in cell wall biosynthesis